MRQLPPQQRKAPPLKIGPAVNFGGLEVGITGAPQNVTLTNISGAPVTIDNVLLTGDAGEFGFNLGQSLPFVLPPSGSEVLTVWFQPLSKGGKSGGVQVQYVGPPDLPVTAPLTGVGLGPIGDELFVNSGGKALVDGRTNQWVKDFGFFGGATKYLTGFVAGTTDQVLYRDRRYGPAFGYEFPLPNGPYSVTVHFAELELPFPGARVFDVLAEGEPAIENLDLSGQGLFGKAHSMSFETDVADGVLSLDFLADVGEAMVSALEVHGMRRLTVTPPSINFGAVSSGSSSTIAVTLESDGLLPVTIDTLSLLLGPAGTPASMSAELLSDLYPGVPSSITYPVAKTLDAGDSATLEVTFAPTSDQYDQCTLRLEGDFGVADVMLTGLGGHEGHPFLHVVIESDDVVVDYDGDGSEPVVLDGSLSHTHEPGASLVGYDWKEGSTPVATGPVASVPFNLGPHSVALTITDNHVPPGTLTGGATFDVVNSADVPGVLVLYHNAADGPETPFTLLQNPPTQPDFVEIAPTPSIGGLTAIGKSPFTQDLLVRMLGRIAIPAAGTYRFDLDGGAQRILYLNGLAMTGPVSLPAGSYAFDARFAVEGVGQIPLEVRISLNGGPYGAIDSTWMTHDQEVIEPVINTMPSIGTSLGGNEITIDGFGFFPYDDVVVHWGAQTFTTAQLESISAYQIVLTSPPGTGVISVTVETPQGTSNPATFTYDASGPVPINFTDLGTVVVSGATAGVWGPDGRFYVTEIDGEITAIEFNPDYSVASKIKYDGIKNLPNHDTLGIAVNPFDPPSPVRLYIAHGDHFLSGGSTFTGPSPYTGQVSILEGPNFNTPIPLITQLPTSNHDHSVNGLVFDHNGDLLLSVGSNTNAGVKHPAMGDLVESPLSAAILKAETSRPDFNGNVTYVFTSSGLPSDDQVFGEQVDVAPGSHVTVHAPGLRNAYDMVLHTNRRLYATDNGPNAGFGAKSTGLTTQGSDPQDKDEVVLIEYGNYYGSANRSRGRYFPRENIYRNGTEPSLPEQFTQALGLINSSLDGIDEYRANTFQGQMRGDLIAQKYQSYTYRIELSSNGRAVTNISQLTTFNNCLGVRTGPGGAILAIGYGANSVHIYVPDDVSATGLRVHDVFPWRGPQSGGTPFTIGGVGFGTLANTVVTFGGVPATLTSVSPTRIRGITPAHGSHGGELVDIVVWVGPQNNTLSKAFRYLYPKGTEPGWWETGLPNTPASIGEVSAGVINGILYLVGEGSSATYRFNLMTGLWMTNAASRPFPGHHHSAEVYDGKLYLMGGLSGGSPGKVQIYNPATDSWTTGADMPWGGGSVSSCVIQGKIYVAGGIVGPTTVANHAMYDPVANTWTARAPMPVGRNHTAAATNGSRFFIFGGRDGGNFVTNGFNDVQIYNPVTNTWMWSGDGVSGLAPLPQYRGGMGKAVYYQGEFYVFGGETQSGPGAVPGKNVYDRVDVYDPVANTWRLEKPMPTARHGISPVLFQSRIFLAAGGTNAGFSSSNVFDLFTRQ